MDKTYKFKFYNRYIVTLRDSQHVGRHALKKKAKAIIDNKLLIMDDSRALKNLGEAIGLLTWDSLNNPKILFDQIQPIFSEELKEKNVSSTEEQVKRLSDYVSKITENEPLEIKDLYNPETVESIRDQLKEQNNAYKEFQSLIDNSEARALVDKIATTIQDYANKYNRDITDLSPTDAQSIQTFIGRFGAVNMDAATELAQIITNYQTQLAEVLKVENKNLQDFVNSNRIKPSKSGKPMHINVLNDLDIQYAENLINRVAQFDSALERIRAPYQVEQIRSKLVEAMQEFYGHYKIYKLLKKNYQLAASETFKSAAEYIVLLKLREDYDNGLTRAQIENTLLDFITSLPIDLQEARKFSAAIESNPKSSEDEKDYANKYITTYTSKASETYPNMILTPSQALDIASQTADEISKELTDEIYAKFNDEFLIKNTKNIKRLYEISDQHLKKLANQLTKTSSQFLSAQAAYNDGYNDYIAALDKYWEVGQIAQNYNIMYDPKYNYLLVREGKLNLADLNTAIKSYMAQKAAQYQSALENARNQDINTESGLRYSIESAKEFIDMLSGDIQTICNISRRKVNPGTPSNITDFIAWFKDEQIHDYAQKGLENNAFLNDIVLPRLEKLIPSEESVAEENPSIKGAALKAKQNAANRAALLKVQPTLNSIFKQYMGSAIFATPEMLLSTLNGTEFDGSTFTRLDDLYDVLDTPISEDEKFFDDGSDHSVKLTNLEILQNRTAEWFKEKFNGEESFIESNPYVDTLIAKELPDVILSNGHLVSRNEFKSILNTYLESQAPDKKNSTAAHNKAYTDLQTAYSSVESDIDKLIAAEAEKIQLITDKKERKQYAEIALPKLINAISGRLMHAPVYASIKTNPDDTGYHLTPKQQGWLHSMLSIAQKAAKKEKDIGALSGILHSILGYPDLVTIYNQNKQDIEKISKNAADEFMAEKNPSNTETKFNNLVTSTMSAIHNIFINKIKSLPNKTENKSELTLQNQLNSMINMTEKAILANKDLSQIPSILKSFIDGVSSVEFYEDVANEVQANQSKDDPVRNISTALEEFLTSPEGKEFKEQFEKIPASEQADVFIKKLIDKGVLVNSSSDNKIALLASYKFEDRIRRILSGENTHYDADWTKNRSPVDNLWFYINNYILKANGLYTMSRRRSWEYPNSRYEMPNHNIMLNPEKIEAANVESNNKVKKYKKRTTADSISDKHCLACSGILKYYKDSELYECPMCHIVYSKSMLK